MTKVMVTGAGGFVGQALCEALRHHGMEFVPVVRRPATAFGAAAVIRNIDDTTDWSRDLCGVDVVVHLAARVHVMKEMSPDAMRAYRLANVDATMNLARQCAASGVRRLIYLSSIKVNGEETSGSPFHAADFPRPEDAYGKSKLEAEQGLKEIAAQTGLEVVVIRPPLVYGPGVKANFLQLMRWVRRGVPFPFGSVRNARDMVYVGNLVDLILVCVSRNLAGYHTFLVSDGRSVSTAELIRAIARAMQRRTVLFPVPPPLLMKGACLLGKETMAKRLLVSLQIDMQSTRRTLEWEPPYSFEQGIDNTVRHFLEAGQSLLHGDS